ncbi:MAG TPA: DUF1513 domain-containing protein [Methyloceanibacter sp.]|jgi:hypothetical protein|nr:DUF1513 domain-containing protein [Methyloceanibacter sp.]
MRPISALLLLLASMSAAQAEADHAADGCGLAPTHQAAHFLLTSGEGWLATADASGAMSRHHSGFQWDNHAILVR